MQILVKSTTIRIVLLIGIYFFPISIFAQETELISFKIKDQFGREYTEKSWGDSILVFIGSDKDGSRYSGAWGIAISDSLRKYSDQSPIKFIPNADLRGVPFFLKGYIRGKFPKEKERWTLLDWKGIFPKTYHYEKKVCNILIFNRERKLIHIVSGHEVDQGKLDEIVEKLKMLLKEEI